MHQYPPLFITAGRKDSRVPYWTVLKYVSRLRQRGVKAKLQTELCKDNIALQVKQGGHFDGGSLDDEAWMWAFLNKVIPYTP